MRKGRFSKPAPEIVQRYSESVSFDWRLCRYDIAGSIAHAAALAQAGIITADEREKIERELRVIEKEIETGKFEWDQSLEDVHMNIEAALTKRIGAAGARLHTAPQPERPDRARSAALCESGDCQWRSKASLVTDCVARFSRTTSRCCDGRLHASATRPADFFTHYLLAQIEALERDSERLRDCNTRTDILPLGSGALAGSTIVLDRQAIARQLGFSRASQNSVDAVGDRDFVCEFLFCLAMVGMHLSRLSEDLITWSTSEFGFVEFSDAFSTGSSLMPQKKNPDVAELARGKTGRLYGNLISVLTMLKALPSSYNRDLQEDKEAVFDSVDTIHATLEVFTAMLPQLKINRERMEAAASDPSLFATDLAEYLVKKGTPFREAHEIVGKLVAHAMQKKVALDKISVSEMKTFSPLFDTDIAKVFDVRRSLAERTAIGAPSPENIAGQIARWRAQL